MTRSMNATATLLRNTVLLLALVVGGASGCASGEELDEAGETMESETGSDALKRGGGGPRLSYSCTSGTCTCDKSIENDCADMSAVCTDATVDALIACINGWLTTHCTCTQAAAAPSPTIFTRPVTTVKTLATR